LKGAKNMNEDTSYEERRMEELGTIANFFTNIYAIPKAFKHYSDYKTFESGKHVYCIEYKNNNAMLKLVIPYSEYAIMDDKIRCIKDLDNVDYEELEKYYSSKIGE
jgi:hypothetical protein